ncbi:DUF4365 domain-containing protein [uncultured Psychrobacter sp.]|uniref:DUF4365 domain-containing protein n=1 Tax=uncultured Psychrobacter sp. TaxID=259303 RepID=UPI002606355E|nr:DUF4365 domain-containing protein [uncultured Psychrobacter sp.]
MTNLPEEGDSQRIGRLAKKALTNHMPLDWIEKEQDGDSDYGIDYLIQLKNDSSQVEFSFYLQLKGTMSPTYNKTHTSISYDFKTTTLAYYHRQEPLVMVAVVDIRDEKKFYECPIYYFWLDEKWFDENAKKLDSQKTISINIPTTNLLNQDLDIYSFYANRFQEKLAFSEIRKGINGLERSVLDTLSLIAKNIDEKPIFLKSIELKNEAPWIDNPKDEVSTDLKMCSDYLSNNRIQAAKVVLEKLNNKQDNFNTHEMAEFYYQKGNILSHEGFRDDAEKYFKLAQEKSSKDRYRLAYLESKFKLHSTLSPDELEESLDTLGSSSLPECALKAKILAMLKRPTEALQLLKQHYPTETTMQMVICTIGYLHEELDLIIEENLGHEFEDDRKTYIFNALAARRFFQKSSNDVGISGEILPIEGRPDYDLEGMKQAFSSLQKAWVAAKKLGYPNDITMLIDISALIYGYFNKLEELTCYFDEILSERTSHSEVIRSYVRILFNCGQYTKVIELLEKLELLDSDECGIHILSYHNLNKSKLCLSLIQKYESILLSSSRENIPAIFCIGAEIADSMFNTDLATRYKDIVKSLPDGEAFIAIQDFVNKSNRDKNRHNEFTQNLYQKYIDLDKPLVIAVQLIRYLNPRDSMTANQLIELAENILETRELSKNRYLDLAQAFITTERWADAERLAEKNIAKGVAASKWKLVQAAALQNQGKVGVAYQIITDVIKLEDIGKQEKDFFINLSLSLGLIDNVVEQLEEDLANSSNTEDQIVIIRRLISIYSNRADYKEKTKTAVLRYGTLVDQNNCDQEGDYLQLCMLLCPFDNDKQFTDYRERQDKYTKKFPDSKVFKVGNINIDEGAEGLLESLRDMAGITPEQIELWESNKQKLRSGELPIPFFMRGLCLQDTRDIFTTWFLSKSSTDQELEFKILHSPQLNKNDFKDLIDTSDILLIEETSILVLNELEVLDSFLESLPRFSILETFFKKINLTAHALLSPYNNIAKEILKSIQNNLTKLDLIHIDEEGSLQYDQPLKNKKGLLITDDLYLKRWISVENHNTQQTGNIFNVLEYLYDKGMLDKSVLQEKIVSGSKLGIVDLNMRLDFLGDSIDYFLGRPEILDYKDTDFQYIFDKIMLFHTDFKIKYKLFLDIFLYVDVQKISPQTLLTLVYKLIESEDSYEPQAVITTWLIHSGLGRKCEKGMENNFSTEHLILWNKYTSVMGILDPESSSIISLLEKVVSVILKLEPEIKSIAFNNLKSGFSSDSIEYSNLKRLDRFFNL